MSVTRSGEIRPEVANLFQAFNHACDGYSAGDVLLVSVNMVVAAINAIEQMSADGSREKALEQAEEIAEQLPRMVANQWDRKPSPSDVEVPHHGN